MEEITHHLNLLADFLHSEVVAHAGHTDGLSARDRAGRFRAVADNLVATRSQAGYRANGSDTIFSNGPYGKEEMDVLKMLVEQFRGKAHPAAVDRLYKFNKESIRQLSGFSASMAAIQARLDHEAHQAALRQAEEVARRHAEEAARQAAQRHAEEVARRQAEEAAWQHAQRQAEAAARVAAENAARALAIQQAEAAAQELARRKAQEAAAEQARRALELAARAAAAQSGEPTTSTSGNETSRLIEFVPGPIASAAIAKATLQMKSAIEAEITRFAHAIAPHIRSDGRAIGESLHHVAVAGSSADQARA